NGASSGGELPQRLTGADAWIVSRLNRVIAEVDGYYTDYEFAKIADLLYHFAWDEVCDWYLELAKVSLADESTAEVTRRVLGEVLDGLLRLLHPLTPFVTEALWTALTGGESIVIADWPQFQEFRLDKAAEDDIVQLQARVMLIRQFLSAQGVKPAQRVPARFSGLGGYEQQIRKLLRLADPAEGFSATATLGLSDGAAVELDLSTAVDVAAERARLERDRAAASKELEQTGKKLANDAFLTKAKPEVIDSVRARNEAAAADLRRVDEALTRLPLS
ncbi:MAG: valyl-tRNA synthetase, partial [Pseudonocardiales bacterium]|nr:valyl-tRNA synthetase [Pseudonocardiales bacterium]